MTSRRRLPYPRYLACAGATALTTGAAYVALFFFQLGPHMPADYWIRDAFIVKEYLAEGADGDGRIFVVAGSGALFGIDSELIESETGRRTVNLAINGGLGFDFIAKQTLSVVRPGDFVLLPLEPSFIQLPMIPQWFFNNVMGWGGWYFDSLSLWEKTRFLFSVDPGRVVAGGVNRCLDARVPETIRKTRNRPRKEIIDQLELAWATGPTPEMMDLPFVRLTRNGDLESNPDSSRPFKCYYKGYLSGDSTVRHDFVHLYTGFRNKLERTDVGFVLLWPATMTDEEFDLSRDADLDTVVQFRRNLEGHGIRIVGSARDAHYPRELFLDTNFHLNSEGREIHTRRLLRLLRTEVPELFSRTGVRLHGTRTRP